jgi:disulfide bond formation protein DsbB
MILLLLGGLAVIATAWGFQLIGGYDPCELCLEQRVPYYVGLPLTVLALVLALKGSNGPAALVLILTVAVFVYGSGLGIYQAGAEWDFWQGPTDCGGGSGAPTSAASMLENLGGYRIVSCTEAALRILGLSFAGWNAVASAGLALLALIGAISLKGAVRERQA